MHCCYVIYHITINSVSSLYFSFKNNVFVFCKEELKNCWRSDLRLLGLSLSQGDYDPVKTRVLHLKMNPTTVAKQQRQQEVEALREEVTHLRELLRSVQDGTALAHSQDDSSMHTSGLGLSLPPSKEVLGKIHNTDSHL